MRSKASGVRKFSSFLSLNNKLDSPFTPAQEGSFTLIPCKARDRVWQAGPKKCGGSRGNSFSGKSFGLLEVLSGDIYNEGSFVKPRCFEVTDVSVSSESAMYLL